MVLGVLLQIGAKDFTVISTGYTVKYTLWLSGFPQALPLGTPSGKWVYLTVYHLSCPNTDTVLPSSCHNTDTVLFFASTVK